MEVDRGARRRKHRRTTYGTLAALAAVGVCSVPAVTVADPLAATAGASADTDASDTTPAPLPPGANGYDDLVAAGDLLLNNNALTAATADTATLTDMRHALADLDCRRALALIRNGLSKNMQAPDGWKMNDKLPQFRRVSQFLGVEQYVFLADGRTEAAIDTLRDTFLVTDAIRGVSLVGATASNAVRSASISELTRHSAEWSEADCRHILQVVRDQMQMSPDTGLAALAADKHTTLLALAGMENEGWVKVGDEVIRPEGGDAAAMARAVAATSVWNAFEADPAARAAFWVQVRQRVGDAYDQAAAMNPFDMQAPLPPALALVSSTDVAIGVPFPASRTAQLEALSSMMVRFNVGNLAEVRRMTAGRELIPLRLLGTHAAIRDYRWENGRLPAALDDLKVPDISTDPYTGKPFQYVPTADGTGYSLTCAAPARTGGNAGTVAPTQLPIDGASWH